MNPSDQYIVIVEPHFALLRYLQVIQRRYRTLVLTHNPQALREAESKYNENPWVAREKSAIDVLVAYEAVDVASMVRALRPFDKQLAGVIAGDDAFVPLAEQVGYALGFDYARPADAECHHIKTAMKRRLVERNVCTPAFVVARDYDTALRSWEKFGRDSMVKMVDLSASVNIFRARSEPELHHAWDAIVNNRRAVKVPFALASEAIIEEFVAGREITVEGYTQDDRIEILNFSQKITEDNFIVVGHYIPAAVTPAEETALAETARQCIRALGLRNSVFHVELHLRGGVPYVIECAARPPGQHTVDLIEKCYGYDLMDISVDLAVSQPIDVRRCEPRAHFAILALYSRQSGILERIEGLDELKTRGGLMHLKLGVKPGDHINALDTFREKFGLVMLQDQSADELRRKAEWLRENVKLVVRPSAPQWRPHVHTAASD
jgi:biotin carboxylase